MNQTDQLTNIPETVKYQHVFNLSGIVDKSLPKINASAFRSFISRQTIIRKQRIINQLLINRSNFTYLKQSTS